MIGAANDGVNAVDRAGGHTWPGACHREPPGPERHEGLGRARAVTRWRRGASAQIVRQPVRVWCPQWNPEGQGARPVDRARRRWLPGCRHSSGEYARSKSMVRPARAQAIAGSTAQPFMKRRVLEKTEKPSPRVAMSSGWLRPSHSSLNSVNMGWAVCPVMW